MNDRRSEAQTAKIVLWLREHSGWALIHPRTGKTWYPDQMDHIPRSLFRAMRRRKPGSIGVLSPEKRGKRSRFN